MADQSMQSDNHTESGWEKAKKLLRALLIFAAVFVVLWILAEAVWLIGIKATWSYVVDSIQDTLGVNTFLARAIVTIGVIPLLWGVVDIFTFSSKRRKFSLSVIAVYVILFNVAMYAATRDQNIRFSDGKVMRYCAVTPGGVFCADKEGFDPSYGIKLEAMTPERIRLVEAYERRLASGSFQPVEITKETTVFDPVSGDPVLYYMTLPAGEYRFFNGPGFDPVSGAELMPATPAVIQAYWGGIERAEQASREEALREQAEVEQQLEAKAQEERVRTQAAQLEARKSELGQYFSLVQTSASLIDVGVAISTPDGLDRQSAETLIGALNSGSANAKFYGTVFRPPFFSSEIVSSVYAGDFKVLQEARELKILPDLERVLIGMLTADCAPGYQDTIRCELSLEYRTFSADGNLLSNGDIQEIGVGFDRRGAFIEGLGKLAEKLQAGSAAVAGV